MAQLQVVIEYLIKAQLLSSRECTIGLLLYSIEWFRMRTESFCSFFLPVSILLLECCRSRWNAGMHSSICEAKTAHATCTFPCDTNGLIPMTVCSVIWMTHAVHRGRNVSQNPHNADFTFIDWMLFCARIRRVCGMPSVSAELKIH